METGERLELQATAMSRDGDGLASKADVDVVVPGLLPGERAIVRIEHVGRRVPERRQRAHGRVLEWLEPSPFRVAPPCLEHEARDGRCSGCPLMVATADAQREQKREWLEKDFGLVVSAVESHGPDLGYRWSSKRVARSSGGRLHLGSFRRGSHLLADMDRCLVDHPDIAEAAREVGAVASFLGITAYDERSRTGDLRYVWLKTNGRGEVLVTLISAHEDTRCRELAESLTRPSGVAWCVQSSEGNAIRGGSVELLRGKGSLSLELAGRAVDVGPLGFLQPNPQVAAVAYRDLCDVHEAPLAYDLYAGAGVTTALLRERCARVVACEAHPESAEGIGTAPETAEDFLERALASGETPAIVVANPPRSGLGEVVCDRLVALAARGLHELRIMSCSPATFGRDRDRLAAAFDLVGLRAFDTLPHTPHVELVAKFSSRRGTD